MFSAQGTAINLKDKSMSGHKSVFQWHYYFHNDKNKFIWSLQFCHGNVHQELEKDFKSTNDIFPINPLNFQDL